MKVEGDLIWGDESQVFAEAHSEDLSLIFRFVRDEEYYNGRSLQNRIVNSYNEFEAYSVGGETFDDRPQYRKALYSSIRRVWPKCTLHPSISASDVVVEIYEDKKYREQWRICHEGTYKAYMESLLPMDSLFVGIEAKPKVYESVDYSSLIQVRHLGGRGNAAVVRRSVSSDELYLFKGVNFGVFLESPWDFSRQMVVCYNEIRTICSLPKHPNIIPPPSVFVTDRKVEDKTKAFVCGTLYPFAGHGSLEDQIKKSKKESKNERKNKSKEKSKCEESESTGTRLTLMDKAVWCYQMALAISYTHFKTHTFHRGITPGNFILDDNKDLILIDWEQNEVPPYALAPEADGSWNVEESRTASSPDEGAVLIEPKLIYTKNERSLEWNVFPIWREHCPRAVEAAEVFSLGRCMLMLLLEKTQSDVKHRGNGDYSWDDCSPYDKADEIPKDWKAVVDRCLKRDANKRIRLSELVEFWEKAKSEK